MPIKDLWVGTADPDPIAIVGSASSCDSMISNDSTSSEMSDSGYDYLSVEEKECLMFLEETLHSLDTEADSGLSTEAEAAEVSKHPRTWPTRDCPKERDHKHLGKHEKIEPKGKKYLSGSVPAVAPSPGHSDLPKSMSVINDIQSSKVFLNKAIQFNSEEPKDLPEIFLASSGQSEIVDMSYRNPKKRNQLQTSDLEFVVVPPPEPFQDQQNGPPRGTLESPLLNKDGHDRAERRKVAAVVQPEDLSGKTELVMGKESNLPSVSPESSKKTCRVVIAAQEGSQKSTMEETTMDYSFKQGPPTAPKPRKLPPNITLITSKNNAVSINVDRNHKIKVPSPVTGRPRAATGDFSMEKMHSFQKEQERARREALKKLGLPLDKENDSDDTIKTSVLSKPRETPRSSSRENVNSSNITMNPGQQPDEAEGKESHPAEMKVSCVKQMNIKSNTLERSGIGLNGSIFPGNEDVNIRSKTSFFDKITPNFLRNSRPRPASLGMGKDFVDLKEGTVHSTEVEDTDKRKSYPLLHPSKLPRPPCVSVKITPKGATDEHRREALKKLGLLKE